MNNITAGKRPLIFAVHPTARGVGWAVFEGALAPVDWAIVRSNKNVRCLALIEKIMDRFAPAVVVIEEFERAPDIRADRMQRLCRAIIHLADNRGYETRTYSRAVIRTCFSSIGAVTRYEIAQAVAMHIPALRHRLPPVRKFYENQDSRIAIFNASALAITDFTVSGAADKMP